MTRVRHAAELAEAMQGRYASLLPQVPHPQPEVQARLRDAQRRIVGRHGRRPRSAQLTLDELDE